MQQKVQKKEMIKIQCRDCGTELPLLYLVEKRNGVCICGRRLIGRSADADRQKSAKTSVEIKAKAEV